MSSNPSKREKFRALFKNPSYTWKEITRPRSTASSGPGTHGPDARRTSSLVVTDSSRVVLPEQQESQTSQTNTDVTPDIPTPTQPSIVTRELDSGPSTTNATQLSGSSTQDHHPETQYKTPHIPPSSLSAASLPLSASEAHSVTEPATKTSLVTPVAKGRSLTEPSSTSRAKDIAFAALKASVDTLRRSTSIIPAFGAFAGLLADCISNIPMAARNHDDFEDLALSIVAAGKGLELHLSKVNPAQMTKAIVDVIEQLNREINYINEKQGRPEAVAYLNVEGDIDDLIRCYRRIERLFRQLQSDAILSVWRIAHDNLIIANESLVDSRLEKLNPAKTARYDSIAASQLRRSGCTPNTRKLVLQDLQDWASDPHGAKVYWMNGMAGTGKTTIAHSFCSSLKASHQLAASFFCSRTLPDCRDVTRIAPTIAYQFARFCGPFRDSLCRILGEDPDIGISDISTQFEKLVSDPLLEVNSAVPAGLLVVVIDALDECSDRETTMMVLEVLLRLAEDMPIKFFVTCRPERSLLGQVLSSEEVSRSLFHLHNIEQSLVRADIGTYLWAELGPIDVPADRIEQLADKSGRLFIYAATAVRYIRAKTISVNTQRRLDVMLEENPDPSRKAYEPLDALYTAILSAALEDNGLEPWDTKNIELILHTVICAREPLPIESLTSLLQLESSELVQQAIEPLRSVLHIDEHSGLVSTLHASFPDYMLTASRSSRFFFDETKHHLLLARCCFGMMKHSLQFNICKLQSSYIRDEDVPDLLSRMNQIITPHLFYACRYWSNHLSLACDANELSTNLRVFLYQQVLFWAEVMNLKKSSTAGVEVLSDAYKWMRTTGMPEEDCAVCQDAQRFMTVVSANPVFKSTPHIYVSVLALWDKTAPMWTHYGTRMEKPAQARGLAIDNRESALLAVWRTRNAVFAVSLSSDGRRVATAGWECNLCVWDPQNGSLVTGPVKGHSATVCSVAFSPDSSRIVSACDDNTLCIWNAKTGYLVTGPFEGHTNWVRSVAFSPTGSHIASGSADSTIRVWDTHTGQNVVGPLHGHHGIVQSVAYSPDGSCIASGSADESIRVWNARSGNMLAGPLIGHTGAVHSVAYSQNGSRVVSGSQDTTIRIWDPQTGDLVAGPFEGHTDTIYSVSYSPDGNQIASSSKDCTIRVWDAQTGQTVTGPLRGHTGAVFSALFLPDGNRIVSGSTDCTVRIWDTRITNAQFHPSEGHTALVNSVNFSPDGSQIVSGSEDRTICIWDVQTGGRVACPIEKHTSTIYSVVFSPNGDYFAVASEDHSIYVWDIKAGQMLPVSFNGHTDVISSVAFSPDGDKVASGCDDYTIRVWDIRTGNTIVGPFTGHTNTINSIAYSPDGARIISGASDCTIRVWDSQSGNMVAGPFEGHTDLIRSVAFSPDGRLIVSGSDDYTIRIWNADLGAAIHGPLKAHTHRVHSVTYSPDGRYIISGSRDYTIYLWDAKTGETLAGPFRAHTNSVWSMAVSPDSRFFASSSGDCSIRVWDLQKCIATRSQDVDNWTVNEDGWVVSHDKSLLLWVPSDLRTGLKWPQNVAMIYQQGYFELDFADALIGPRWEECYRPG